MFTKAIINSRILYEDTFIYSGIICFHQSDVYGHSLSIPLDQSNKGALSGFSFQHNMDKEHHGWYLVNYLSKLHKQFTQTTKFFYETS